MSKIRNFLVYFVVSIFLITSCNIVPNNKDEPLNELEVVSVAIFKLPSKLEYYLNEKIDLTNGEIIVYFEDGSTKIENITENMLLDDDYFIHTGVNNISIAYENNDQTYIANYQVFVKDPYYAVNTLEIFEYKDKIVISDNIKNYNFYSIVKPEIATNQAVRWLSSNQNVAVIDQNGLMTIIGKGSTNITLTSIDNPKLEIITEIIVVKAEDIAAIASLIKLLDNYYKNIKETDYTKENYLNLKNIYNETIEKINEIYVYEEAYKIYLNGYKLIAEIPKIISYFFNPYPTLPQILYAAFVLDGNNLNVLSSGLVNPTLIGISSIDYLTVSESVGEGSVTIENLTIIEELIINGGGINSAILNNVTSNTITVNKQNLNQVKLELNGGLHHELIIQTPTKLQLNTNLEILTIENDQLTEILGNGQIIELITNSSLKLDEGVVVINLLVEETDEVIEIELDSSIINLVNESEIILRGAGTIENALVHNSITNYLDLINMLIPCDCPLDVEVINNGSIIDLDILKANVTITGSNPIGYVTLNIDQGLISMLNTPNTIFKVISGGFDINGFIYTSLNENATDEDGNFTCEYCLEIYRTLVLNKLNLIKLNTDYKTYKPEDYNLLIDDIEDLIDVVTDATSPLAIQIVDNQIQSILDLYPVYKYIKELVSFTIVGINRVVTIGETIELAQGEVNLDITTGMVYYLNNFDKVEVEPLDLILKNTDPTQASIIDLSTIGNYTKTYSIEPIPDNLLNSNNFELSVYYQVMLESEITPILSLIEINGPSEVTIMFEGSNNETYTAVGKDQFNNVVDSLVIEFSLFENYNGVTISDLGELTVEDFAETREVLIKAVAIATPTIFKYLTINLVNEAMIPTTIMLDGPQTATVYLYATNFVEFSVIVLDQYDNPLIIQPLVIWSIIDGGISVIDGQVEIPNTTTVDSIIVKVELSENNSIYDQLTLNFIQEQQIVTEISIGGPDNIKLKKHGATTANYSETVLDQYGVIIENSLVNWSLSEFIDGVSISATTGQVTLQDYVIATTLTIIVVSSENELVTAQKIVNITR